MDFKSALHLLKNSNLEFYKNYKEDFLIMGTTLNYIFSSRDFIKRDADVFYYPNTLGGLSNTKFNTRYLTTRPIKANETAQDIFKRFFAQMKIPIKLDCKSFALFTYSFMQSIMNPKRRHISIFPDGIFQLEPYYNFKIKNKEIRPIKSKPIHCDKDKLTKILPEVSLLYVYIAYDENSLASYHPNLNGYLGNLFMNFARTNDAQGEWCIWIKELDKAICLTIHSGIEEMSIKTMYITIFKIKILFFFYLTSF